MLARLANAFRRKQWSYDLLPTSEWASAHGAAHAQPPRWRVWRRCGFTVLFSMFMGIAMSIALLVFVILSPWIWRTKVLASIFGPKPLPPLYPEFKKAELALPQHHVKDPFAAGQKYLWVASHVSWTGWGNFMQDMVLTAHLTYRSGRTYVFDDYTWDKHGPAYSKFDDKRWIPSRIPLSAIISGPIVGGPFPDGDATPRAIAKAHWDKICPNPTLIDGEEVRRIHGPGATSVQIERAWLDYLSKIDDPCVEVPESSGNIFHIFSFGNKEEMLPIWPLLSASPILTLLGWSTLAHQALETNRHLFAPAPLAPPYVLHPACPNCVDPYAPLDGLLALHLRRGDFIEHCPNLCHWGAGFNAFNQFPEFPDRWEAPQGEEDHRMAVYLRRCLPTVEQIVEKVEAIRASAAGAGLKNVYIMTNGDRAWLGELHDALRRVHAWEHIATSRDTVLTHEQKYVSQAMDMLVGERAQVFVGNGFSSLSSNIAMLRMGRGLSPNSTRMW